MTTCPELTPVNAFKKPIGDVSHRYDESPGEMSFDPGTLIGE